MEFLERKALQEQRRQRRKWKRLNLPHYIKKVQEYRTRVKDAQQRRANIAFDAALQADILKRLKVSDQPQVDPLKSSPSTCTYTDAYLLNVWFSTCDLYDLDDVGLDELELDLRRWSTTPFQRPSYDRQDTLFNRFLQLAEEYGIEFGSYDISQTDEVVAYLKATRHQIRPSVSDDSTDILIPIGEQIDSEEDIFIDFISSLTEDDELAFTIDVASLKPQTSIAILGKSWSERVVSYDRPGRNECTRTLKATARPLIH